MTARRDGNPRQGIKNMRQVTFVPGWDARHVCELRPGIETAKVSRVLDNENSAILMNGMVRIIGKQDDEIQRLKKQIAVLLAMTSASAAINE